MKIHSLNHTLRTITQHRDEKTQSQSHTEDHYTAPRWRYRALIPHWGPLHSTKMKIQSHNHTLRTITQNWDVETQPQSHTEDLFTAQRWIDTATTTHWGPLHRTEMERNSQNNTLRFITQNQDLETQSESHTQDHYTALRWRATATVTHWGPL